MALPLALSGCLLTLAGAALVFRSRVELGPAWSFVPTASQEAGLVTTGPYYYCVTSGNGAEACGSALRSTDIARGFGPGPR
jgi:hypothetical protein